MRSYSVGTTTDKLLQVHGMTFIPRTPVEKIAVLNWEVSLPVKVALSPTEGIAGGDNATTFC